MGDLREPNLSFVLASPEDRPASLPSYSDLSSISPERWVIAEKATHRIILKVLPTAVSDERRRQVIDYVYCLIGTHLGCQVFPYGSVPLKTYLPDGDIDLTAFGGSSSEDWAESFVSVLKGEDRNKDAEFIVKDVQLIRAEVKIVKCIVQNIVVDISLNQIGGLCTLCFLEQVDRLIGKDHLFKRSIILVKAWCYYESRLLGAPHGLISTYALETLVLYIFHFYHSILDGPLAVLYKFLEYFSKFDWENYGISLNGPVRLASLPEFVVEMPENGGGDLLLSSEFLRHCIATFSVPSRRNDSNSRTFQAKYLNIVDPLKENNNLGRSVAKGNFFRIRSAFTYGARKLCRVLMQPGCDINKELTSFFSNTLDRHGSGQRPDVRGPFCVHRYGNVNPKVLLSEAEACPPEISTPESKSSVSVETMDECCSNQNESAEGVNDIGTSALNAKYREEIGHHDGSVQVLPSGSVREPERHMKGNVLGHRIRMVGDDKDLASYKIENLKVSSDEAKSSNLVGKVNVSSMRMPFFAPHLYFSNSKAKCGSQAAATDSKQPEKRGKNVNTEKSCGYNGFNGCGMKNDDVDKGGVLPAHSSTKPVVYSRTLPHTMSDLFRGSEEALESAETLSVLEGDYDAHFNSLKYGRSCFEYAPGVSLLPILSLSPSLYQRRRPWEALQNSTVPKANGFPHMVVNGVILGSPFYVMNSLIAPGMNFGSEDIRKPRGTGTYFPNPNRPAQGFRPTTARARYITSPRTPGTGESDTFNEGNMLGLNSRKLSLSTELDDQSRVMQAPSDNRQKVSPRAKWHASSNGVVSHSEGDVECGSACKTSVEVPIMEKGRQWQRKDFTATPQNSSLVSSTGTVQSQDPVFSEDKDRVSKKSSYHLKDEDDFPPLSV